MLNEISIYELSYIPTNIIIVIYMLEEYMISLQYRVYTYKYLKSKLEISLRNKSVKEDEQGDSSEQQIFISALA